MTALAYRDGVLASDSAVITGTLVCGNAKKIARGPDGTLGGAVGDYGSAARFLEWIRNGAAGEFKPDSDSDEGFAALIVRPNGSVERMSSKGAVMIVSAPWHARGSAETFLAGAMAAGAGAEEAVRLAIQHDAWIRGEVQVERLMGDY